MKKKQAEFDMLSETDFPLDLLQSPDQEWSMFDDVDLGSALETHFPENLGRPISRQTPDSDFFTDTGFSDTGPDLVSENEPDAAWFANDEDDMPGLDLTDTSVMKEGSLNDLSWLELHEQDEDRLPVNPVNLGIPELEEAWGVNRRTDGFNLQSSNRDLSEIRYRASIENPAAPKLRFSAADLTHVVQRAMRRSADGHALAAILREAAQTLGDESHRIKQAMENLKAEHGLLGKVFLRASAYPGYERGQWAEQIRRHASARYIVVDERTLKGSVTVQGGRCMVTKKQAVLAVPWAQAVQYYRPALERLGRKVAGGDPREALKAALNAAPKVERQATVFPQHKVPAQRVSAEEARRQFAATPAATRQVLDPKTAREAENRRKADHRIKAWVQSGMLPRADATAILASNLTGEKMLRSAAEIIIRTKGASTFSGLLNDARPRVASSAEARASLASIEAPSPVNKMASAVVAYARRMMSQGVVGRALDDLLSARFASQVRVAAESGLAAVRKQHEGASGFVYVDASAYASTAGVAGCEQGSLKHRANQLKFVLAMDRCSGCTLSAKRADGSAVCRQYNKTLITAADLPPEMAGIRRENIRSSNMSDQEATASYFAPTYDPQEYNLHNASFEDLEIEAAPEHERMGQILFGGMEF